MEVKSLRHGMPPTRPPNLHTHRPEENSGIREKDNELGEAEG